LKKIIFMVALFILILSGCSSKNDNTQNIPEVTPPVSGEKAEIESISDSDERDKFQKIIEDFYYNPVINDETSNSLFENAELVTKFAAHYKVEYGTEVSLEKIAEMFFGNEVKVVQLAGMESFSGYDNAKKTKYLPVVEGVYKNDNFIIVKAGVYSLAEESNSEKKIFGTITATFEKSGVAEEYYFIDYIYEKVVLEES